MSVHPEHQQALHQTVESAVARALDSHANRIDTSGFVNRHELDAARKAARDRLGDEFQDPQFVAKYNSTSIKVLSSW